MYSFLEYYWLLDLGFRSATLKYSAHYRATSEDDKVNEVINTGLGYSSIAAALLVFATFLLAGYANQFFEKIPAAYQSVFITLIVMVGCAWAVGTVFSLLSGVVEGYQRFDLTSRVWILTNVLRTAGLITVLALGYKLEAMATVAIASLAVGYACNYLNVREVFPALHLSFSRMSMAMFRRMLGYGVHTSVATVANQLQNMAGPLLVAHFLPVAFVGYFSLPVKLLRYSVDLVCKVGYVTGSSAAEMAARGERDAVYRMALYVNRYCYALFAPMALALSLYGTELLRVWINPEFALNSGPIVPVIAVSTTWGIAAQYNSSSILYGLGRHQRYAYSLLVEAVLGFAATCVAIPRYGIVGAAWIPAVLMVLNRGLFTSWLFCQAVERGFGAYLRGVYLGPTLAAIPALLGGWWVKVHWLPGRNWIEVLAGMGLLTVAYYLVAFPVCVDKAHRSIPWRWVTERLRPHPAA